MSGCYSDHNEDVRTKGACDYCGGTEVDAACRHCGRPIRSTSDTSVPWVHQDSGNGFCDVATPADAVGARWANWTGLRASAEPVEGSPME